MIFFDGLYVFITLKAKFPVGISLLQVVISRTQMSWSDFFYYDKTWKGKKYPFKNGTFLPFKLPLKMFMF